MVIDALTAQGEIMTLDDLSQITTSSQMTTLSRITAQDLTLGYEGNAVYQNLDVDIPDGKLTAIIGPNGCGKSTLLRSLCRLLKPHQGNVLLDGRDIHQINSKHVAQQIALLPQSANAPEGIRVFDLVARGRFPHQSMLRQWSNRDEAAVRHAMLATGIENLADRPVEQLSGGQRQRVWIAMVLAQDTPIIFLDEPTTYLDISHQVELLELLAELNCRQGKTIVAVLHDLNQACRYADHLIVLAKGKKVAEGTPKALMTPELLRQVFELECVVIDDPVSMTPLIVPKGRVKASPQAIASPLD